MQRTIEKNGIHAINVSLQPPQTSSDRQRDSLNGDDIVGCFIFCYLLFILTSSMHPSPLVLRQPWRLTGFMVNACCFYNVPGEGGEGAERVPPPLGFVAIVVEGPRGVWAPAGGQIPGGSHPPCLNLSQENNR